MTVVVDQLLYEPLAEACNVLILKNRWRKFEYEVLALDLTPYDITFKTDADMLFPRGCSLYHPPHLPFTSGVATDILGRVTNSTAFREVEIGAGLPTIYSACFSFYKRTKEAKAFFASLEYAFAHWYELRIWDYAERKLVPTTDTAYSIAHLDVVGPTRLDGNLFVHCKPYINAWTNEDWTKERKFNFDRALNMNIDGVKLIHPFHYFDKSLITDQLIARLEHATNSKSSVDH
jgi:hypothetical protein